MLRSRASLLPGLSLAVVLLLPRPALAAESYDTCTGFIDSVPAIVSTQGTWCLRRDLATSITSSNAITIATNNVTIDCNDFKLGGLAAGNASQANGIYASSRQNATIRNCSIRGFRYGIRILSGAGHLVEHNRLDNNLYAGIYVSGDNNLVQRNRVHDTGGASGGQWSHGIDAQANILDNIVSGLFADQAGGYLTGIHSGADGARVAGNSVSGFVMTAVQGGAVGSARGLFSSGQHTRLSENQVHGGDLAPITGPGLWVNGGDYSSAYCIGNTVGGFSTNLLQCTVSESNLTLP